MNNTNTEASDTVGAAAHSERGIQRERDIEKEKEADRPRQRDRKMEMETE